MATKTKATKTKTDHAAEAAAHAAAVRRWDEQRSRNDRRMEEATEEHESAKARLAAHEYTRLLEEVRETGARLQHAADYTGSLLAQATGAAEAAIPTRLRAAIARVDSEWSGLRLQDATPEVIQRTEELYQQRKRLRDLTFSEWTAASLEEAIRAIVSDPDA